MTSRFLIVPLEATWWFSNQVYFWSVLTETHRPQALNPVGAAVCQHLHNTTKLISISCWSSVPKWWKYSFLLFWTQHNHLGLLLLACVKLIVHGVRGVESNGFLLYHQTSVSRKLNSPCLLPSQQLSSQELPPLEYTMQWHTLCSIILLAHFQACHHGVERGGIFAFTLKPTHDETAATGLSHGFQVSCSCAAVVNSL